MISIFHDTGSVLRTRALELMTAHHDHREADPLCQDVYRLATTSTLGSYPSVPRSFYYVKRCMLLGKEIEGSPGVVTGTAETFYAWNVGSTVPPLGQQVECSFIDTRWIFRHDG
jgi:hypothetical protein